MSKKHSVRRKEQVSVSSKIQHAITSQNEPALTRLLKSELKSASETSAIGAQQFFAVTAYAQLLSAMYLEYEQVLKQAVDDMKRLQATLK